MAMALNRMKIQRTGPLKFLCLCDVCELFSFTFSFLSTFHPNFPEQIHMCIRALSRLACVRWMRKISKTIQLRLTCRYDPEKGLAQSHFALQPSPSRIFHTRVH